MYKLYLLIVLFFSFTFKAQTILNAYAKVTNISGAKSTLIVTNVNEVSHTFNVGEQIIIMQMQDDVIGTNTTNIASFGDISASGIANAGTYEIGVINSKLPAIGTPTSITLSWALSSAFNTGPNSSVQIITLRNLGLNYTTTSAIGGLTWNGNIGGVVAIQVTNTLTLNHSIIADVIGFKKGLINSNAVAGACLPTLFITNSVSQAFKGEGIYKVTNANFANARGKILNGGGGGNEHNGGGGGGGNYTNGGAGGDGYSCGTGTNSAGGLGGIGLSAYINPTRVYMGGGGGGGQQNNTSGLDGGPGGGIIFIKASTITTNSVCGSAIRISANGGNTANCGNDGAGGGGAAGSIILQVNSYSVSSTCTLAINANGGKGGDVGDNTAHGGGGGGGQGVIMFSTPQPTVNITSTATSGAGGKNKNNGPTAESGGGVPNSGILTISGPLPIELLYFNAVQENLDVKLYWATATEINNDFFTVERSSDGVNFTNIGTLNAVGNSQSTNHYQLYDYAPVNGINYYRLKQTDVNTEFTYSNIVSVTFENEISFSVFPNPANDGDLIYATFDKTFSTGVLECEVYDITGKQIVSKRINLQESTNQPIQISESKLAKGMYLVRFYNNRVSETKKVIIN